MPKIPCGVPGCTEPLYRSERCSYHYRYFRATRPDAPPVDVWRYEAAESGRYGECPQTMIYAILRAGDPPAVKIGLSSQPERRLADMQTGSPDELILLCAIRGFFQEERAVHSILSEYHIRGEWFRFEGAVKEFIGRMSELDERIPSTKTNTRDTWMTLMLSIEDYERQASRK